MNNIGGLIMPNIKIKKKLILSSTVVLISLTFILVNNTSGTTNCFYSSNSLNNGYIEIDKLTIGSNEDLLTQATANGWVGTGTEVAPIIIEGYWLKDFVYGFTFFDTDLHVVIRNNKITGFIDNTSECSLVFTRCSNIIIEDNTFLQPDNAITIFTGTSNITFRNNSVNMCRANGLKIVGGSNISVYNNTIFNCNQNGIYIHSTVDSFFEDNIIYNNLMNGFFLEKVSKNNLIDGNNITNNVEYGVKIDSFSESNTVSNNIILDNKAPYLDEGTDNVFKNNHTGSNTTTGSGIFIILSVFPILLVNKKRK